MAQNDKIAKLEDLVQFWKQIIRVSDTVATKYFIIDLVPISRIML